MGNIAFTSRTGNPDFDGVFDVSPEDVASAKASDIVLIDVREPSEFVGELGHIRDSELIVLHTLPEHLDRLPQDKTIVFICKSGGRSARAAAFAQANGFNQVYNMKGGMILWNSKGLPVEK